VKKIGTAVALSGLLLVAGCGGDASADEATAVCVDPNTGARVDDSQCGNSDSGMNGFLWFYIMTSLNQPSIGTQVVHNNYYSSTQTNRYAGYKVPPNVTSVYRSVPKTGWTPNAGTKSFTSGKKVNVTVPSVIQQKNKPMYSPKAPVNKPPVYKPPAYKPPAKR
jgi:hypothetical protein